ncbi:Asparagine synthetase [glutamine-hydrolyzing], partial [hydrothermal vent metagenome]
GVVARALTHVSEIEGSDQCIVSGITRLMGGHCLTIRQGGQPVVSRWWRTLDHIEEPPRGIKKQAERLRELFFDACRIRMRSDVPVGGALSGGLDSGSVFCAVSELMKSPGFAENSGGEGIKAFVATFTGTPQDERKYAERIVRHTGVPAVYKEIDPLDGLGALDEILYSFEEIFDMASAPWLLYRGMREENIVVSMDGHGGDELFGGYDFQVEDALRASIWAEPDKERYNELKIVLKQMCPGGARNDFPAFIGPGHINKVVIYGCGQAGRMAVGRAAERGWDTLYCVDSDKEMWGGELEGAKIKSPEALLEKNYDMIIVASGLGKEEIYERLNSMGLKKDKDYIFFRDIPDMKERDGVWPANAFSAESINLPWLRVERAPYIPPVHNDDMDALKKMEVMNRRLYSDFHFTTLPTILRNFDRNSMAHGVEIRSPFMDWRLVCFAFSLPWSAKVGDGFTKRILREALRGVLPESIRTRATKVGFASPVLQWVEGPLKPFIMDTLNSRAFLDSEIWDGPMIEKIIKQAYGKGDFATVRHFWHCLQTQRLFETFADKKRSFMARMT